MTMSRTSWRLLFTFAVAIAAAPSAEASAGGPMTSWFRRVLPRLFADAEPELAKSAASAAAPRINKLVTTHGDDVFRAVEKGGKDSIQLIERHGAPAIKLIEAHGAKAIPMLEKDGAVALIVRLGDDAALAMLRHPGVAQPLLEKYGAPALPGLLKVGPRSARQLAMIAEGGTPLGNTSNFGRLLQIAGKYGDKAVRYVGQHKAALFVAAAAVAFLDDPEPFITGAKDIAQVALDNTVKPLAEVPGEVAREIANKTDWTFVFSLCVAAIAFVYLARDALRARVSSAHFASVEVGGNSGVPTMDAALPPADKTSREASEAHPADRTPPAA